MGDILSTFVHGLIDLLGATPGKLVGIAPLLLIVMLIALVWIPWQTIPMTNTKVVGPNAMSQRPWADRPVDVRAGPGADGRVTPARPWHGGASGRFREAGGVGEPVCAGGGHGRHLCRGSRIGRA